MAQHPRGDGASLMQRFDATINYSIKVPSLPPALFPPLVYNLTILEPLSLSMHGPIKS